MPTQSKKLRRREALTGVLFSSPAIIGISVFFVIPFIYAVYLSFIRSVNITGLVGFRNYLDMIQNPTFQLAAWNTARFIFVAVPLIMAFSFIVALLLFKKLRGTRFFSSVFVFPLVVPVASVVLFFQIIFDVDGLVNSLLTTLNFAGIDWLNSEYTFSVLVILYIWKNCGYNIILFLAALNTIPKEYYEVLSLETNNPFKRMYHVTLPMISPYIFFILCISIINTFKSFREAFILGGDYPHTSIYMIQHFMSNNIRNLNYTRMSVAAVLVFIAITILVLIAFRFRTHAGEKDS